MAELLAPAINSASTFRSRILDHLVLCCRAKSQCRALTLCARRGSTGLSCSIGLECASTFTPLLADIQARIELSCRGESQGRVLIVCDRRRFDGSSCSIVLECVISLLPLVELNKASLSFDVTVSHITCKEDRVIL